MDYLAYLVIYLFISFGVIPSVLSMSTYTESVKVGFVAQFYFALFVAVLCLVVWAFNQAGLL